MSSKQPAPMTVGFIRIFVADFPAALSFYSTILGMKVDYTDGSHWAQFVSGPEVALAIERCPADRMECGAKLVGRYVGVTLMVDDIRAQYEILKHRGVKFLGAPETQKFGGTMAHFQDPEGNVLGLRQEED